MFSGTQRGPETREQTQLRSEIQVRSSGSREHTLHLLSPGTLQSPDGTFQIQPKARGRGSPGGAGMGPCLSDTRKGKAWSGQKVRQKPGLGVEEESDSGEDSPGGPPGP